MSSFCPTCEDLRETRREARQETYKVRGQEITVPVSVEVCTDCGEALGDDQQDQQIITAAYDEYRRQHHLLRPGEIKEIRERYRLSQKSFAALLGMSEATINRYEQGSLQEQSHDNAIRACQDPQFVRDLLQRHGDLLSQWQRKRVEETLAGQEAADSGCLLLQSETGWTGMPQEVSECTGFRRFDYDRFAFVVVRLCQMLGEISTTVINKLLFYTDFLNFKTTTVSLTGAAYLRLDYGPVPPEYDGLLSRMEAAGILIRRERDFPNGYTGYYYQTGPNADSLGVELTPHEQKVLEHVAGTLGRLNAKTISDHSHQESAWLNTEDKQLISYKEAATLSLTLEG
jgi:putative zinc finger/helix-turn-helix YgiT family protein